MIVCNCGEKFEDACGHTRHKVTVRKNGGDIEAHHSVCSSCMNEIFFDNPHSFMIAGKKKITGVYCLPCATIVVEKEVKGKSGIAFR